MRGPKKELIEKAISEKITSKENEKTHLFKEHIEERLSELKGSFAEHPVETQKTGRFSKREETPGYTLIKNNHFDKRKGSTLLVEDEVEPLKIDLPEKMKLTELVSQDKFPKKESEITKFGTLQSTTERYIKKDKKDDWDMPNHLKRIIYGNSIEADLKAKMPIIEIDGKLYYACTADDIDLIKRFRQAASEGKNPEDISLEGIKIEHTFILRDNDFLKSAPEKFLRNIYIYLPKKPIFGFLKGERMPIELFSNLDIPKGNKNKFNKGGFANSVSEGFVASRLEENNEIEGNSLVTHRCFNQGPLRDYGIDIHILQKKDEENYINFIENKNELGLPLSSGEYNKLNTEKKLQLCDITSIQNVNAKNDVLEKHSFPSQHKDILSKICRNFFDDKMSLENLEEMEKNNIILDNEKMLFLISHPFNIGWLKNLTTSNDKIKAFCLSEIKERSFDAPKYLLNKFEVVFVSMAPNIENTHVVPVSTDALNSSSPIDILHESS